MLAAAVRLFNTHGYDATSMFDIAESLGITKSTLYHHVNSKEQLLTMAVDRALGALEAAADEATRSGNAATVRLKQLIRDSVLVLADRLEFVTLLLRVHGNTVAEQQALTRRRAFDRTVTDLVKQAQMEGGVRADVDPATAARLLFGMVNSLIGWYRPDRGAPQSIADTVADLAFDGLRTR